MQTDLPTVIETLRLLGSSEGRRVGHERFFRCVSPAHEDAHPSLRVNESKDAWRCDPCDAGGKSIALVTHAGKASDYAAALAFLAVEPNMSAATYRYEDATGGLLYTVERRPGKQFSQRSADGTPSLQGVARVPYRLPQLTEAVANGETIVVVEGEKDADALRDLGFTATTNSGGAPYKWPNEWQTFFTGAKRVVVIADSDAPGRKAAAKRATLLAEWCADVRFLDLAPDRSDGYDASDYLAEHGAQALRDAIEQAPAFEESDQQRVTLTRASDLVAREPEFLVAPYIPIGEITWLEGPTKVGKTMVALDLIARATRGEPFVNGAELRQMNVAIVSAEDDYCRTLLPRLKAAEADLARVQFLKKGEGLPSLANDLADLESRLAENGVKLLFVDGTIGLLGVKDGNDYSEAYQRLTPLTAMLRRLGIAALLVRHVRKTAGNALDRGIGSVGYGALGRSTLIVGLDPRDESGATRILAHAGSNLGELGPSCAFTVAGVSVETFTRPIGRVVWGECVNLTADDVSAPRALANPTERNEAEAFLRDLLTAPMPASEVLGAAQTAGFNSRTIQRAARRLGVAIAREGFGKGSIWTPPEPPIRDTSPIRDTFATLLKPVANVANGVANGELAEPCRFFVGDPKQAQTCGRCGGSWGEHASQATGREVA